MPNPFRSQPLYGGGHDHGRDARNAANRSDIHRNRAIGLATDSNLANTPYGRINRLHSLGVRMAFLGESTRQVVVAPGDEDHGMSPLAVAPSPARLLVVRFECWRKRHVGDHAHVWFVDTHPERTGGRDVPRAPFKPPLLHAGASLGIQPRVVGLRGNPFLSQRLGPELGSLPRPGIHQAAAGHGVGNFDQLGALVFFAQYAPDDVRAVEASHHYARLFQCKLFHNVSADGGRSCSRYRKNGRRAALRTR